MQLRHVCSRPSAPGTSHKPERGAERVAGARVVARDLVRGAEPLVDLGGLERELVLERQRRALPGWSRCPSSNAPSLDAGDAFEPHRAGAQVGALGAQRLLARARAAVGAASAWRPGALQVAGDDEPLGGGLARAARWRRRPPRRRDARRARARGRPGARRSRRSAARRRRARGPAPSARRAATTSRCARAASARSPASSACAAYCSTTAMPLAPRSPSGQSVERLAPEPGGVAVGVDRGTRSSIASSSASSARRSSRAASQCAGDLRRIVRRRARSASAKRAVQRPAAQPRHVVVDRVARERVAERAHVPPRSRRAARARAARRAPASPPSAGDEVEVERRAPRPPRPRRPRGRGRRAAARLDEDGVADGLGQRRRRRRARAPARPGRRRGDRSSAAPR